MEQSKESTQSKESSQKHPGGRPTKYSEEILEKAREYLQKCVDNSAIPFIEQLAFQLDINDETVLEWEKKYEEFSATIKRVRQLQKFMLLSGSLNETYNVTASIFQLKANHGLIETSRSELTGKDGERLSNLIQVNESNKPIALADNSQKE